MQKPARYIAYYRVSTDRQGRSGLGLEAQRRAVVEFVIGQGGDLAAEYTEIESGRKNNRPELRAALEACRQRKAQLVTAKLDRLARNVAFVSGLMETGTTFVAVDMPHANKFMLHVLAAVAEYEREMISKRIIEAMAVAKSRGVKMGNPRPLPSLARGRETIAAQLATHRELVQPLAAQLREEGQSLRAIASELNRRGVPTAHGRRWHPESVSRLLETA